MKSITVHVVIHGEVQCANLAIQRATLELMDCCLWSLSVVSVSFTLSHNLIMS